MLRPVVLWPELLTILIAAGDGFSGWASLNDTIMGGRSSGEMLRELRRFADAGRGGGRRWWLCELPFAGMATTPRSLIGNGSALTASG